MCDPFVSKFNWLRYLLFGSAIGTTLLVVAVTVSVVTINFSNYQDSEGLPEVGSPSAQVSLGNLWNGIQLPANESFMVNATAFGPEVFNSIELWLDGQLAGVQAAPIGGALPFSTYFSWLPNDPGSHSLIAAAIDAQGRRILSDQVVVLITSDPDGVPLPTADADTAPVVLPASSAAGYFPPHPPGADSAVSPSEPWRGTPGGWANNLLANELPVAPEIVANARGCGAELLIHDLSTNEQGFLIYQEDSYSPTWTNIDTLNANSQSDWISYLDGGLPGTTTYYVSAYNSQGEAQSNLATVFIDPAECPPESGTASGYTLEVTKLIPEVEVDKCYCYQSTDGINWSRWPSTGFLQTNEEGYILGGPVINVLDTGLPGEDITPRSDVEMECWGWNGAVLVKLGYFFVEESFPAFQSSYPVPGKGIAAEVTLNQTKLVGEPSYPVPSTGSELSTPGYQDLLTTSISPVIPHVILNSTFDPNECRPYLPPHAQNADGQAKYCFEVPRPDPSPTTHIMQPWLIWDISGSCLEGSSESCMRYSELLALAEASGGVVGFEVTSTSNIGTFTWSVTEPNLRMYVVPPLACSGDIDYRVRLWFKPGPKGIGFFTAGEISGPAAEIDSSDFMEAGQPAAEVESSDFVEAGQPGAEVDEPTFSEADQPEVEPGSPYAVGEAAPPAEFGEIYYGMPSNLVTLPCVPLEEIAQYLDFTFHTVEFFEIDDGDVYIDNPQDAELYGFIRVEAPSMGQKMDADPCLVPWPCIDYDDDWDEDSYMAYINRNINIADWEGHDGEQYCPGCTVMVVDGVYDLSDWEVCQSTNQYGCLYEGQETQYKKNNNTIRVFVKEGDALKVNIHFIDYDEASGDDWVCYAWDVIPSRSLEEWGLVQDEPISLSSKLDTSGRCTVEGVLNAVNP